MLVGDLILMCRELIPDVPGTIPAPIVTAVNPVAGTIPAGTYSVQLTLLNPWGESAASIAQNVTLAAPGGIQIFFGELFAGVTSARIYLSGTGTFPGSIYIPNNIVQSPITVSTLNQTSAVPPIRSSAFLPDTDGGAFSAGTLFRWLSQALTEASREVGGIMDYTGVGSVQGQPLYTLPGEWLSLSDVWYDGYPVSMVGRNTFFRRNTVQSSILGAVTVSVRDNRVIAEVWPQPARTATVTTTSANILATDSVIPLTTTAGFVLPFGFAQIGNEVVSYSKLSGSALNGCIRALSGAIATAWPAGTVAQELNLFANGKRIFTTPYVSGQSAIAIPVPAGWDEMLVHYMLSKAKQAEQDFQEAARLRKLFDEALTGFMRANRQLAGPRQVTLRDEEFTIANPHPFGGTVLP